MAFEGEITLVPAEALGSIIIKLRELRQIHPQSPHPSPGVQPAKSAFWGNTLGNTPDLIAQQDGPPDAVTS